MSGETQILAGILEERKNWWYSLESEGTNEAARIFGVL
jgi:hypothetical protein